MPKLTSHRQRPSQPQGAAHPPPVPEPAAGSLPSEQLRADLASPAPAPAPAALVPPQPRAGLLGLPIVAVGFVLLGIVPGGPQAALETVGPIATFALPVLAASALWWAGWPAQRLRQPWAGIVNLALIIAAGIALTIAAQALVGHVDLTGTFTQVPAGAPVFTTWPWTMPLGVLVFVATLQITFVNERWPLHRVGGPAGGLLVIAVSWVVGLAVYLFVVNWDVVPAPVRAAIGLNNPGGPVDGLELLGWLAVVTAFQVLFYIGLGGWPTNRLRHRGARLVAANVFVIGGGWATWAVLAKVLGWATPTIAALGASIAAAAVLSALLFDNWPATAIQHPDARLALTALQIAVLTAVLFYGLRALGNGLQTWDRDPVELWVTVSNLNFIAATAIAHVAVCHRWPVLRTSTR